MSCLRRRDVLGLTCTASTKFSRTIDEGTDRADTVITERYFDGGFTVLLSGDVQWDIRDGVDRNDAAANYFVGSGLSIRFK